MREFKTKYLTLMMARGHTPQRQAQKERAVKIALDSSFSLNGKQKWNSEMLDLY